jgi:superfamily II helicase
MIEITVTHEAMGVKVSASAKIGPHDVDGIAEMVRQLNDALREKSKVKRCALCLRALKDVAMLVTSSTGNYVCDDCAEEAMRLVTEDRERKNNALKENADEPG